jgi:Leucine-rich repeat (LRR) protein
MKYSTIGKAEGMWNRAICNVMKNMATRRYYLRLSLLSSLAIVSVSLSTNATAGLYSGVEYDALIAFYGSTNGASWTISSNWGAGNACDWYGVSCDQNTTPADNTSHVVAINLPNNKLTGTLPALTAFAQLVILEVRTNRLTGSIPSLGGLANLTFFDVGGNQLSGSIPSFNNSTAIDNFIAASNQLSGSIPSLTELINLSNFDVGGNQLTGPIPDLTGLTNLSSFIVQENLLTGPIPALDASPALQILSVGGNQLSGQVPAAPSSLIASLSTLCPNLLDTTPQPSIDPAWNAATNYSPWWANPFPNNKCDDTFTNGFGG